MYKMTHSNSRHISWLYLYLGGFILGIIVTNICRNYFLGDMDLLNAASLSRMKYLEIDKNAFFVYAIRERMGTTLILCLVATTYIGILLVSMYAVWLGVMSGVFLSIAAIRYGIKGILLVLAGILPQYILFVPACIMLMNWCYQICAGMYFPHKVFESGYGNHKQYYLKKLMQLFIILGVVMAGSMVESYVNPILLTSFLKIF